MKKSFTYLAMTSCFILGSTFAHADSDSSQGKMHDKMFKAMDMNSDGRVTREEFNDYGAKKFQEMDTNGNGDITSEEMKAGYKRMNEGGRNSGGTAGDPADTSRGRSPSSRGNSVSEQGQYLGSGVSGGEAGGADSTDGLAASSESRRDEAARVGSSGRSRGAGNMDDTWDQKRDDAWHQNSDSTWDKKRDDAWHKQ